MNDKEKALYKKCVIEGSYRVQPHEIYTAHTLIEKGFLKIARKLENGIIVEVKM